MSWAWWPHVYSPEFDNAHMKHIVLQNGIWLLPRLFVWGYIWQIVWSMIEYRCWATLKNLTKMMTNIFCSKRCICQWRLICHISILYNGVSKSIPASRTLPPQSLDFCHCWDFCWHKSNLLVKIKRGCQLFGTLCGCEGLLACPYPQMICPYKVQLLEMHETLRWATPFPSPILNGSYLLS